MLGKALVLPWTLNTIELRSVHMTHEKFQFSPSFASYLQRIMEIFKRFGAFEGLYIGICLKKHLKNYCK